MDMSTSIVIPLQAHDQWHKEKRQCISCKPSLGLYIHLSHHLRFFTAGEVHVFLRAGGGRNNA